MNDENLTSSKLESCHYGKHNIRFHQPKDSFIVQNVPNTFAAAKYIPVVTPVPDCLR